MKKCLGLFLFLVLICSGCEFTLNLEGTTTTNDSSTTTNDSSTTTNQNTSTTNSSLIDTNAIIADHNSISLNSIPLNYIEIAQNTFNGVYWHTSHGSQIISGIDGLVDFKGSSYAWDLTGNDSIPFLDDNSETDLGNGGWDDITRDYLDNNPDVNYVMWSWCSQVSGATSQSIEDYLLDMTALEGEYEDVTFIYMTGHVDGSGVTGNLNQRNQQIRDYCIANDKVLFDFADIESYDPDGNYYLDKYCNDECDYDSDGNSTLDANWATAWQGSHTLDVDWYDCGAAHSESINANMKAYAFWYMMAVMAGWNGIS